MGGHGGLNILPQKRWNVYNYENREKVRRDEEAAAKQEQFEREQSRKRDAEFRLERLRLLRGLSTHVLSDQPIENKESNHINLFEGISFFSSSEIMQNAGNAMSKDASAKRQKKCESGASKVMLPEDEKYRLGYGVAGKDVKVPWYLFRPSADKDDTEICNREAIGICGSPSNKKTAMKSLEELREERLKRERREKERERKLVLSSIGRNKYSTGRRSS